MDAATVLNGGGNPGGKPVHYRTYVARGGIKCGTRGSKDSKTGAGGEVRENFTKSGRLAARMGEGVRRRGRRENSISLSRGGA